MVEVFRNRRARCMDGLETIPLLDALEPEATFYLYVDATAALAADGFPDTVDAIANWLLDEHKVVIVPGTAFGDDRHLRMSFASSDEVLDEAFVRLARAFS
jgi:aspartate aminotransferase